MKIALLPVYRELGIFCYFTKSSVLKAIIYLHFISVEAGAIKVK